MRRRPGGRRRPSVKRRDQGVNRCVAPSSGVREPGRSLSVPAIVEAGEHLGLARRHARPEVHHEGAADGAVAGGHRRHRHHVVGVRRALEAPERVEVDVVRVERGGRVVEDDGAVLGDP